MVSRLSKIHGEGSIFSGVRYPTGQRAWRILHDSGKGSREGYLGQIADEPAAGRGDLAAGSLRSRSQSHLLGASRKSKPWNYLSRKLTPLTRRSRQLHRGSESGHRQAGLGISSMRPANRSTSMEVFERVLVDIGDQKVSLSAGKAGILWKWIGDGKYLAIKKWSSRR